MEVHRSNITMDDEGSRIDLTDILDSPRWTLGVDILETLDQSGFKAFQRLMEIEILNAPERRENQAVCYREDRTID